MRSICCKVVVALRRISYSHPSQSSLRKWQCWLGSWARIWVRVTAVAVCWPELAAVNCWETAAPSVVARLSWPGWEAVA